MSNRTVRKGRYGVDGPGWLSGLFAGVAAPLLAVAAGGPRWLLRIPPVVAAPAGLYLHSTLRGKFLVWEEELDALRLSGDEHVLDLGCGRGAVLTAVAHRVPKGRVTGVDLWRSVDQSGNNERATTDNIRRAGIVAETELLTADMRKLPLENGRFDLVVSSMAIHNIPGAAGRRDAVREAYRVLKPGGRLLIIDILHTSDYLDALHTTDAVNISRTGAGPRMWWSGPWVGTSVVSAEKPPADPGPGEPSHPDPSEND
ncbi:class I SAM-dependent methyltransferase [Streptomyces sp. NPDC102402]|uniref:class I SAM-dependent methyltransferase n=1 Tax=Streptomyces sp. NPDC102402 TaxID=3366169 RepID=UPI0038300C07